MERTKVEWPTVHSGDAVYRRVGPNEWEAEVNGVTARVTFIPNWGGIYQWRASIPEWPLCYEMCPTRTEAMAWAREEAKSRFAGSR